MRNFHVFLVQETGEKPSSTAAAMSQAKLPAQLKSEDVYFCKFISLRKPLETQKWHSLIVSITR